MQYSGVLENVTDGQAVTRVMAVAGNRVLAATAVDAEGRWGLDVDSEPTWIIAQQRERAVAAIASVPGKVARLALPGLVSLELEQDGGPPGVAAWIDPIDLTGFPKHLVWALFAEPGGIVDMHVVELHLQAGARPVTVPVQPGRYRLSGGTVSLRPSVTVEPVGLAGVTEVASGRRINSDSGQVVVDVHGRVRYRLHFTSARVSGTDGTVRIFRR